MWTLTPPAGSPSTLASLGITAARLSRVSAAVETLDLEFSDPDHAATAWATGDPVTLLRSGSAYWTGTVAPPSRRGAPAAHTRSVRIEGAWAQLDRLVYAASRTHYRPGTGLQSSPEHPIASLGRNGTATDTRAALIEILTYAAAKGVPITIGNLPDTRLVPIIETHGRSCSDLIRQILRWHPDCVATIDATNALHIIPPASQTAHSLDAGGRPLSDFDLTLRDDLVPENVIISYEAMVADPDVDLTDPDYNPDHQRRLYIYQDTAGGATIGLNTLLGTIPIQLSTTGEPTRQEQETVTRPIPAAGATDAAAERWWIDHSSVGRWGLTTSDIILPATTSGDIYAHAIYAAPLPSDVADPPTFWTAVLASLPNELVDGVIHRWMSRSFGRVRARVTMGIRKTALDALAEPVLTEALRSVRPTTTSISGQDAYLLDLEVEVPATNASTRTYTQTTYPGADGVPTVASQIIPGLAQAVYDSMSTAAWEGRLTLSHDEAGETRYQGACVNITHPNRPEWATMRAAVQAEQIDLFTGSTTLTVGGPKHLSIQDWAEHLRVLRDPVRRRSLNSAATAADDAAAVWTPGAVATAKGPTGTAPGQTRSVIPPEQSPGRLKWDLTAAETAGQYTLTAGRVYHGDTAQTLTSNPLTVEPVAGKSIYLEADSVSSPTWTLVFDTTPAAAYTVDSGAMEYYRRIIVDFVATDPGDGALPLGSLYARWRVPDCDLTVASVVFAVSFLAYTGIALDPL